MDKYEFNIKVEQIKKLVNKSDFDTAMKIADTIDWKRVRNTNLLSMIAQVYEKNEEYQEAKDILLMAFERAPIGKRLLYKLTELALKEGNISEGEAYYREFCDLASDDPRQHLLRYLILKEKGAPSEQLIHSLERYTSIELEEKWLYELAELYQTAGMRDDCVKMCDRIMLMFGLGKYVDKAMELKQQYAPLSGYQMDLVENRDKYEAKLRAVAQEFSGGSDSLDDEYDDMEDMPRSSLEEDLVAKMREAEVEEGLARELSKISIEDYPEEEDAMGQTRILTNIRNMKPVHETAGAMTETGISSDKSPSMPYRFMEDEEVTPQDRDEYDQGEYEEDSEEPIIEELDWDQEPEPEPEQKTTNHLMIEANTPEKGLELAVEALKQIHQAMGTKHPVAKITGEKLNKKGIFAVADKLIGKDLIIERAGDLAQTVLNELDELMTQDTSGMIVILIDTPKRIESLHGHNSSLAVKFDCIGTNKEPEFDINQLGEALSRQMDAQEAVVKDILVKTEPQATGSAPSDIQPSYQQPATQNTIYQNQGYQENAHGEAVYEKPVNPVPYQQEPTFRESTYRKPVKSPSKPSAQPVPLASARPVIPAAPTKQVEEPEEYIEEQEMDLDEFAQYACRYANEIDCNISGKSMLALYERIEIMEEDGIPLTRENAEVMIEEAADRAEKPSVGKLIKGVFSSRYDKDGMLILKEEHFID